MRRQSRRTSLRTRPGDVLDEIEGKLPYQIDRQHLRLERRLKFRPDGDGFVIGCAELSTAIDRSSSHEIPNLTDQRLVGLQSSCETFNDVFE